jgi:hypothetical protein
MNPKSDWQSLRFSLGLVFCVGLSLYCAKAGLEYVRSCRYRSMGAYYAAQEKAAVERGNTARAMWLGKMRRAYENWAIHPNQAPTFEPPPPPVR